MKKQLTNLKQETLDIIKELDNKEISWAKICVYKLFHDGYEFITLTPEHNKEDEGQFFNRLDFEYSNDFGLQYIGGVIVFTDGTWMERAEYDGSEWWSYKGYPSFDDYKPETE